MSETKEIPRIIQGLDCCDGVWIHADWCNEKKPERRFEVGDRVKDSDKGVGIVTYTSYIKNEGGIEARCLIHWNYNEKQTWIVEGNLESD